MRRHSHERHPLIFVQYPLAGKSPPVRRQPHDKGRRGVLLHRARSPRTNRDNDLPLHEANEALQSLREDRIKGAAVLIV
jgi:hypothetical protein